MVLEAKKTLGSGSREAPTLAAWLEERCRVERLSYRQAAAKAMVSHATISAIRKGARPSAAIIVKLAKAFSADGSNQRGVLEDHLLGLCGYRSERSEIKLSEPLARLLDRLSQFDDEQLNAIEHIIEFSARLGNKTWG
ncbi:hypothetical protein ES705_19812 [subsurface metagenome]